MEGRVSVPAVMSAGILLALSVWADVVHAQCVVPTDDLVISTDTLLCPGTYELPHGIEINAEDVIVCGMDTTLCGNGTGFGITAVSSDYITLVNVTVRNYFHGLHFHECEHLTITHCNIWDTPELPEGEVFLDIFDGPGGGYGHAIWLKECHASAVTDNNVEGQQNGISLFDCQDVLVAGNEASYNSGWGIYLYNTHNSTILRNRAEYCTRDYYGWSGGDAASLLMVMGSSHNQVLDNSFIGGGDGVFVVGLAYYAYSDPCHHNTFVGNDCSKSPNNGFEATFSEYNVFENNISDGCHYGYWLGYSSHSEIRANRICDNYADGIAIEHGHENVVEGNLLSGNAVGVHLWTDADDYFVGLLPDNKDSHSTTVIGNVLANNGCAVRCQAFDSDRYSYGHALTGNAVDGNAVGLSLLETDDSVVSGNFLRDNLDLGLAVQQGAGNTIFDNYFYNDHDASGTGDHAWNVDPAPGPSIVGGPYLGGNYWPDYAGLDTDGDGLGDTELPFTSFGIQTGGDYRPLVWDDPDCNHNGVADEIETDCNDNGVPDDCDLVAGTCADCNLNGVPDACDLAAETSLDCNANGIPDECDIVALWSTSFEAEVPIGAGADVSFEVAQPPVAIGAVTFEFAVSADLSDSGEAIHAYVNGTPVGIIFMWNGADCASPPTADSLVLTADEFNRAVAGGDASIQLVATAYVAPSCPTPYVGLTVSYPIALDCNGNGTPDECDIAEGTSADTDGDGIPDECQGPAVCPGDMNCDGIVDYADIELFVAALGCPGGEPSCWSGDCPWRSGDCDGDGLVDYSDIESFTARIGSTCQ